MAAPAQEDGAVPLPEPSAEDVPSGANQGEDDVAPVVPVAVSTSLAPSSKAVLECESPSARQRRRGERRERDTLKLGHVDVADSVAPAPSVRSEGPPVVPSLPTYAEIVIVQPASEGRAHSHALSITQRLSEAYPRDVHVTRCRLDQVLNSRPAVTYSSHQGVPVPKLQVRVVDVHPSTRHVQQIIGSYLLNETGALRMFVLLPFVFPVDDQSEGVEPAPWSDEGDQPKKRVQAGRRGRKDKSTVVTQLEAIAGNAVLRVPHSATDYPHDAADAIEKAAEGGIDVFASAFTAERRAVSSLSCKPPQTERSLCENAELTKRRAMYRGYQRGRFFHAQKRAPVKRDVPSSGKYEEPKFKYTPPRCTAFAKTSKVKGIDTGNKVPAEVLTIDASYREVTLERSQQEANAEVVDKMSARCMRPTSNPSGYAYERAGLHGCIVDTEGTKPQQRFVYYQYYDVPYALRNTACAPMTTLRPPEVAKPPEPPPDVLHRLNLDNSRLTSSQHARHASPFAGFGRLEKAVAEVGHSSLTENRQPSALTSLVQYSYEGQLDHALPTRPRHTNRNTSCVQEERREWKDFYRLAPTDATATTQPGLEAVQDGANGVDQHVDIGTCKSQELMMAAWVDYHNRLATNDRQCLMSPRPEKQHVEPLSPAPPRHTVPAVQAEAGKPNRERLALRWLPGDEGQDDVQVPPDHVQEARKPGTLLDNPVHPAFKRQAHLTIENVVQNAKTCTQASRAPLLEPGRRAWMDAIELDGDECLAPVECERKPEDEMKTDEWMYELQANPEIDMTRVQDTRPNHESKTKLVKSTSLPQAASASESVRSSTNTSRCGSQATSLCTTSGPYSPSTTSRTQNFRNFNEVYECLHSPGRNVQAVAPSRPASASTSVRPTAAWAEERPEIAAGGQQGRSEEYVLHRKRSAVAFMDTDPAAPTQNTHVRMFLLCCTAVAVTVVALGVWDMIDQDSATDRDVLQPYAALGAVQLNVTLLELELLVAAAREGQDRSFPQELIPVLQGLCILLLLAALIWACRVRKLSDTVLADRRLLEQMMPPTIIENIHARRSIAILHPQLTFCFTDVVGFTRWSASMSPAQLVSVLDGVFTKFDEIALLHGVFKVKTMGDAYMGVTGIGGDPTHASSMIQTPIHIRMGVSTGPAVSGVIGKLKPVYDFWGDTVNMASRMESSGKVDRINCTPATYNVLVASGADYIFEKQSDVFIKGRGKMDTYLVGDKDQPAAERPAERSVSDGSTTNNALSQLEMIQSIENYQEDLRQVFYAVTALSEELELPKFMHVVVQTLCRLLICERTTLFMVDEETRMMWSFHPVYRGKKIRMSMNTGVAGRCAMSRETVNISDAYNDPLFNRLVDQVTGFKTRNLLAFPVLRAKKVVAVVQAVNKRNGNFTIQDEFLIALMGRVIAAQLEHSLIYEKLLGNESKQQILLNVSRDLNVHGNNITNLFESVTSGARLIVDCDRVSLFLLDTQSGMLCSMTTTSTGEKETIRVPVGAGIIGKVAQSGEKLNVEEARKCSYFDATYDLRTGYHTRSVLAVPIVEPSDNTVTGVLMVMNKQTHPDPDPVKSRTDMIAFCEEDESYLTAFASYIAMCMRNVRLFEMQERQQQAMRMMLRVSVMSSDMRSHSDMIDLFQKEIPAILECAQCRIFMATGQAMLSVKQKTSFNDLPLHRSTSGIVGQVALGEVDCYNTSEQLRFDEEALYCAEFDNSWGLSAGIKTALVLPLKLDDLIVGAIQVINKKSLSLLEQVTNSKNVFTRNDVQLLQEASAVVAVHLAQQCRRESVSTKTASSRLLMSNSAQSLLSAPRLDFLLTSPHRRAHPVTSASVSELI